MFRCGHNMFLLFTNKTNLLWGPIHWEALNCRIKPNSSATELITGLDPDQFDAVHNFTTPISDPA
jgi:hypothetical protein